MLSSLTEVPLFAALPEVARVELAARARLHTLAARQVLWRQGRRCASWRWWRRGGWR